MCVSVGICAVEMWRAQVPCTRNNYCVDARFYCTAIFGKTFVAGLGDFIYMTKVRCNEKAGAENTCMALLVTSAL